MWNLYKNYCQKTIYQRNSVFWGFFGQWLLENGKYKILFLLHENSEQLKSFCKWMSMEFCLRTRGQSPCAEWGFFLPQKVWHSLVLSWLLFRNHLLKAWRIICPTYPSSLLGFEIILKFVMQVQMGREVWWYRGNKRGLYEFVKFNSWNWWELGMK